MDDTAWPHGSSTVAPADNGENGANESSAKLTNGSATLQSSKGYQSVPVSSADLKAEKADPTFVENQMAIMFDDELHTAANRSAHVQEMHDNAEVFDVKTEELFAFLQVVTATFMSFAHGANDVANAIAPFAAIYTTYVSGDVSDESAVPIWILAMGGFGIVCGLTLSGYRVRSRERARIKTGPRI